MDTIELFVKRGDDTYKVILSGEALKDVEDMTDKLGTKSIIEAIVYSIRILSQGLKEAGSGKHKIDLPNGKKVEVELGVES